MTKEARLHSLKCSRSALPRLTRYLTQQEQLVCRLHTMLATKLALRRCAEEAFSTLGDALRMMTRAASECFHALDKQVLAASRSEHTRHGSTAVVSLIMGVPCSQLSAVCQLCAAPKAMQACPHLLSVPGGWSGLS